METLATREAYELEESDARDRQSRSLFAWQSLLVGTVLFIQLSGRASELPYHSGDLSIRMVVATMGGLAVALVSTWWTGRLEKARRDRSLDRVFRDDPTVVPPAPAGATHRLPCALVLRPRLGIGGILYVRAGGLVFQPHYARSRWHDRILGRQRRKPTAVEIGPPRATILQVGYVRRGPLQRLMGRPAQPLLLIRWASGAAPFRIPLVHETTLRLQDCIDRLRDQETAAARMTHEVPDSVIHAPCGRQAESAAAFR